MLVFQEGGKLEYLKKPLGITTNLTTSVIWHQAGIKPEPHCGEANAVTTVPSLLFFIFEGVLKNSKDI